MYDMIKFLHKDIDFKLTHQKVLKEWIENILKTHSYRSGSIVYQLTNDSEILRVNRDFLGHDYFTDIITFDTTEYDNGRNISTDKISADIIISVDTVRENAKEYNTTFYTELYRVIVHGILHLVGYDDHTDIDREEMRIEEDKALELLKSYGL